MDDFAESYLGRLRKIAGSRPLLMPDARIIIENAEGKILLQKRSEFELCGLPGGNAEPGEAISTTVICEVAEETGILIYNPVPIGFGSDPVRETVTFPNGDACQFFALTFLTQDCSGESRMIGSESLALEWTAPDNLPEMLPNMATSVRAFKTYCETGRFQMF